MRNGVKGTKSSEGGAVVIGVQNGLSEREYRTGSLNVRKKGSAVLYSEYASEET